MDTQNKKTILIINPPRFNGMNVRRDERSADVLDGEVSPFYQGAVLAQYLRVNNEVVVRVFDANGLNAEYSAVEKWISDNSGAFLAIIKAADDTLLFDAETGRICKKFGISTMLWEPILSPADPEKIFKIINSKEKSIDYLILGEAEATVSDFLKQGELSSGIAFEKDGRFFLNQRQESCRLNSLEELPIPDFNDLPISNYRSWFGEGPWMTLFSSRGCPGRCQYCLIGGSTVFRGYGRGLRFQSAQRILAEVKILVEKHGVRHITFWDDCFTINRDRVVEFCRLVKESGLRFRWSCMSRADLIDDELVKMMKSAGLSRIGFGVESGSQRILDFIPKHISVEQNYKAIEMARKNGIWVWIYLVVGLLEEDWETVKETIAFVKKTKPDYLFLGVNTPFPGTVNFEECKKLGLIEGDMIEAITKGEFTTGAEVTAASKYMTREEIATAKYLIHKAYVFSSWRIFLAKIFSNYYRWFNFSYWFSKFKYFILGKK